MRILMGNTYHYLRGGDSAYALGISQALERRGHTVVPFAMRGDRNLPTPFEPYFAPELDYPAMQAAGGPANAWRVASNSVYNRDARRALSRLLDEHPVDLVHLHSVMHHLTASIVLEARRRRIPLVWTLHDAKACCPTTHFMREGEVCRACAGGRFHQALRHRCKRGSLAASAIVTLELYLHRWWRIYERADLLLTPSRFLRDTLVGTGLRPKRIEVLANFVDVEAFTPGASGGDELLYVGRLSPEKGLATLVRAMARVPALQLRIAGEGELREPLERLVREERAANVHFEGHVDRPRLRELLARSLALVLPSECDENCPLVVLEALAAGRAVLASRRGGVPELIEEGRTGSLVAEAGVEAWAAALGRLRSDAPGWRAMGENARRVAVERFAETAHVDALEARYAEVLSGAVRP